MHGLLLTSLLHCTTDQWQRTDASFIAWTILWHLWERIKYLPVYYHTCRLVYQQTWGYLFHKMLRKMNVHMMYPHHIRNTSLRRNGTSLLFMLQSLCTHQIPQIRCTRRRQTLLVLWWKQHIIDSTTNDKSSWVEEVVQWHTARDSIRRYLNFVTCTMISRLMKLGFKSMFPLQTHILLMDNTIMTVVKDRYLGI